jgi:hypothetical protein
MNKLELKPLKCLTSYVSISCLISYATGSSKDDTTLLIERRECRVELARNSPEFVILPVSKQYDSL